MLQSQYEHGWRAALARFKVAVFPMPGPGSIKNMAAAATPIADVARAAPRALAAAAPAAANAAGGFMRGAKGALGLGALGAAGALAYGAHRHNENDRQQQSLVYAPLSGSF